MIFERYSKQMVNLLQDRNWDDVLELATAIQEVWRKNGQLFICGNGGSAGNAIHLANDFLYGVANDKSRRGIKVEALSANPAVITCLANDIGYEEIYSVQIETKGGSGDLLLVLSGSGNSPNIVRALEAGKAMGMRTFAILGYTGGYCKDLADTTIHFPINDMQIAEDLQLTVGHMCMQWLCSENTNE
ncbi:uncharacterized protein METZ01_LOCUS494731 [marine metagenome]|uniref:SIS domain-containing protein n=1 Tax=marine metagenome TaxID=408172 RepID=A0A383DBK8_9ZZZZ